MGTRFDTDPATWSSLSESSHSVQALWRSLYSRFFSLLTAVLDVSRSPNRRRDSDSRVLWCRNNSRKGTLGLLFGVALCDLNVGKTKECGQLSCGFAEFCSPIDNTCKHCSKICNEGHNQEIVMCNQHCQDYIHDMRYARRGENVASYGDKEQIQKLQVLSTISLIISLVVLVCLVFLIITLWLNKKTKFNIFKLTTQARRKKEKPDITRKDDLPQISPSEISTIRVQDDKVSNLHDIGDKSRMPQMDFSTLTTTFKNYHARSEPESVSSVYTNKSNRTAQPLAVRLPSEDSTLDFMYDNPALAPSPTLEKDKETPGRVNGNDT